MPDDALTTAKGPLHSLLSAWAWRPWVPVFAYPRLFHALASFFSAFTTRPRALLIGAMGLAFGLLLINREGRMIVYLEMALWLFLHASLQVRTRAGAGRKVIAFCLTALLAEASRDPDFSSLAAGLWGLEASWKEPGCVLYPDSCCDRASLLLHLSISTLLGLTSFPGELYVAMASPLYLGWMARVVAVQVV